MRFAFLILFLSSCAVLRGQVAIGGKPYVRSMAEAGTKGEWVMYEKGAPQNEGTRRWLTQRVLVELEAQGHKQNKIWLINNEKQ